MSKLIVTHINPDPDAITSVWLLRRFDPAYETAGVAFVPAGTSYENQPADHDPDIVHVDTGHGQFDHHETDGRTCAAKLVLDHLQTKFDYLKNNEILDRLVEIIIGDDHFEDCYWPEPTHDRYNFFFGEILHGLKQNNTVTDHGLVDLGSTCLDGIYTSLKLKIEAEQEIQTGIEIQTKWGKGLAIESKNDTVLTVAQRMGYVVVVRKDPEGMVRIKAQPHSNVDFTELYETVKARDPEATWFLHASKKMLLNGSYKNPNSVFSKLSLDEIIELLKVSGN